MTYNRRCGRAPQNAGPRAFTATPSRTVTYRFRPHGAPMPGVHPTGPVTSLWRLSQEPAVMLSSPRLLVSIKIEGTGTLERIMRDFRG